LLPAELAAAFHAMVKCDEAHCIVCCMLPGSGHPMFIDDAGRAAGAR
jgi:hypothetical protein